MDRREFIRAALQGGMVVLVGCGCQRKTSMLAAGKVPRSPQDPYKADAYCGLYCGACDWMMATRAYEAACKVPGSQPKQPEFLCHGCKTDLLPGWCASCDIRRCARSKSVEFCFECNEYPCTKLLAFRDDGHAHHAWGVRQQEIIRRKGKDAWLIEQRNRWSCPNCGQAHGYYVRKCSRCGQAVRGCRADL